MNPANSPRLHYALVQSPLGKLLITASETAIHHILFEDMVETEYLLHAEAAMQENIDHWLIQRADIQLTEYFSGHRQQFDIPLAARGTGFQHKVWAQLCLIPYAITWNYGQLAQALGQPTAARAVGMANGRNPLSIVVPCHRVIGKNQQLTGYAGGLERKAWLLAHETRHR